jgi:glycine C-acetyltransferase
MTAPLQIAFFGSSLLSAYWNGAATYYRGIVRALSDRGHRITFYEPDAYGRQTHRDIDDSHATGVLGKHGRGTAEHFGLLGEIDVITSTLGKALGGAAGGFVAGSAALTDYLTQRSRPQLFSNALPPTVAASALAAVRLIESQPERVEKLRENARYFREQITEAGFKPLPGETPIIPIIVGETAAAIQMSDTLLEEGVFVTGFGFPVVPHGQARVRCQISAAHTRDDLDVAVRAFKKVGQRLKIV